MPLRQPRSRPRGRWFESSRPDHFPSSGVQRDSTCPAMSSVTLRPLDSATPSDSWLPNPTVRQPVPSSTPSCARRFALSPNIEGVNTSGIDQARDCEYHCQAVRERAKPGRAATPRVQVRGGPRQSAPRWARGARRTSRHRRRRVVCRTSSTRIRARHAGGASAATDTRARRVRMRRYF
jgi:hypothetical protein